MAAKRKQEERHLKLLREMTTLLHNRKCFDCDQRGPTYADMTIGSFVCTSCSGILRGLNPPHRVKSISMTTFTLQEIEFLRTHGNDVCKQIWLGLYDENSSVYPDFRDPQKVKVFLQEKYEKKRWFVPAERAWAVAAAHASISGSSASSASSTPEIKPGKSQTSDTTPALPLNKGTPTQSPAASRSQGSQQEKKVAPFDLLADLGGDIFATPQSAPPYFANFAHFNSHTGGSSASTNAHFANFDNFPKSSSADFGAFCFSGSDTSVIKAHAVSEDKYAALADLDNVFSSNTQTQGASSQRTNFGSTPVGSSVMTANQSSSANNVFGTVQSVTTTQGHQGVNTTPAAFGAATNPFVIAPVLPPPAATNPFQTNGRTAVSFGTASMSMPTLFATRAGYSLPTSFSGGFQQPVLSAPGAFSQHSAFPPHPTGGGFSSFGQPKPMLMPYSQQMGVSTNPFLAGAPMGQFPTGNSSTNPFL
ncbi:arf-GAP domain and FG repeat-containing protein 1 isoform X5 [Amblyraja radiata]|uniref:arf-GAP domain and FG repeat-containing protein 1 isoform X5 n=1 Tax=Amblyraja radiata TaxID=386614 RepID=UPI001401DD58|nr:arf-GAP domain and FG repeat-containing protein 1 isoform X5 [Amblyraja radiata]